MAGFTWLVDMVICSTLAASEFPEPFAESVAPIELSPSQARVVLTRP